MISVIVPFYNAESTLSSLLSALQRQTLPHSEFEVILINNNSTDDGPKIVTKFIDASLQLNIKLLHYLDKASSYAARNFGVRHAKGEILAFTDADCIPEPGWLEEIKSFFPKRINSILSGHIDLKIVDRKNIWEAFDKVAHMNNERKAAQSCVATANMAVRKIDFMKVGYFLEVTSGADYGWSQSAQSVGLTVEFIRQAVVIHPTRKTKSEITQKLFRIATGQAEISSKNSRAILTSTLVYGLRILFPIRLFRYTYGVYKYAGLSLSLKFLWEYFEISLKQVVVFSKKIN